MPQTRMLAIVAGASLMLGGLAGPVAAQDAESSAAPAASAAPTSSLGPPSVTPNPVPLDAPAGSGTGVRLQTDLGDIVIGLFDESAPVASENFLNLVNAGFYDGLGFHRIVEDFVIQGGDPNGDGTGGPGYTIPDEEVVGEYGRGVVAMARNQQPDSQGSQFFIVLDDSAQAALDAARTYVIFGRVVEGMDVVDAIAARGPASDLVEDPVIIQKATVEQVELPPEPTAAPPSEAKVAAEALRATLPTEVAGVEMTGESFTADQVLTGSGGDAIDQLTSIAADNGADINALSVATSGAQDGDTFAFVLAATIPGVAADLIAEPMTQLILGDTSDDITTQAEVAGRQVTQITTPADGSAGASPDVAPQDVTYVIPSDEVLYFVFADPADLDEVISALP